MVESGIARKIAYELLNPDLYDRSRTIVRSICLLLREHLGFLIEFSNLSKKCIYNTYIYISSCLPAMKCLEVICICTKCLLCECMMYLYSGLSEVDVFVFACDVICGFGIIENNEKTGKQNIILFQQRKYRFVWLYSETTIITTCCCSMRSLIFKRKFNRDSNRWFVWIHRYVL